MSAETAALIRYMVDSGVPHRVTSVLRPGAVTAAGFPSRHALGLAVDFAARTPGNDTEELAAIFNALAKVAPQLHELIYAGPQVSANVKRGQWVPKYATAGHHDHCHVAVEPGVLVKWPGRPLPVPEVPMPDDPNVPNAASPVVALVPTPSGAGYWIVTKTGEVFAFGDARYYGRVEAPAS